jgi:MYXO-CTERM domain-containing protein
MNTIADMERSDNSSKWGLLGLLGLFGLAGLRKKEYTSKFTTSATPQNR